MTYLDYSATCPPDDEVIETFVKSTKYIGNPNSLHALGIKANKLISASTNQIASILGVKPNEIIYTSSSSEANNTALKGIKTNIKNPHIITTSLEHSSVTIPLKYLKNKGYIIDTVPLKDGIVDQDELIKLISKDTVLVTINTVNSETGIRQPIEEIATILKQYPWVIFHTDATQAIGKIKIDLTNVDMVSFSAHKFFGIKGIGALIKKENIKLEPLIHGGKSTTLYRSGTPSTELIVSMAKALRLAYQNIEEDNKRILFLNQMLKEELKKYKNVYINSNQYSIPHILNISVLSIKPETMLHALEEDDIYISTKSACSVKNISNVVLAITNNLNRAESSIRISISRKTTKEEIKKFLKSFEKNYKKLEMR